MTSEVSIEQKLVDALGQRKACDFSTHTKADELDNSDAWGSDWNEAARCQLLQGLSGLLRGRAPREDREAPTREKRY